MMWGAFLVMENPLETAEKQTQLLNIIQMFLNVQKCRKIV